MLKQQQRQPWAPGPAVLVAMVPSCWPARFHQRSLSATVPVLAAATARKKKKIVVCILMAAEALNTTSGKNKEKMLRDRESSQDEVKSLWNVLNTTWTFYDINFLMSKHSSPKVVFFFVLFLVSWQRMSAFLSRLFPTVISDNGTLGSLLDEKHELVAKKAKRCIGQHTATKIRTLSWLWR